MSTIKNTSVMASLLLAGSLTLAGCTKSDPAASSADVGANLPATPPAVAADPAAAPVRQADDLVKTTPAPTSIGTSSSKPVAAELLGNEVLAPTTVSAASYLRSDPALVNLGEMATNETKTGALTLTNISSEPVTIERAKTSCGCTTAGIEPGTVINPGESVEVSVSLRGGAQAQTLTKTISFLVPGMQPLVVPVRGQTVEYVQVSPTILDKNVNADGLVTLRAIDNQAFRITGMSPPLMAVNDLPAEFATVQQIKFPWDTFEQQGLTRRVTFHLDHPRVQSVFVNIRVDSTELLNPNRNAATQPSNASTNAAPRAGMALVAEMFKQGQTDEIIKRLDEGLSVESRDNTNQTMLALAARYSGGGMVSLLIERGADVDAMDNAGRTPLMTAGQYGNLEALQVLIDSGAQVNARDKIGNTPLSWAAGFGSPAGVKELIESGADIEAVSSVTGWTPLIWAAGFGDPESVRILIEAGANKEVGDIMQGATPLINAARTGKLGSIVVLIEGGANLETKDRNGKTALLAACENAGGTADKVDVLIKAGADVFATDSRGKTAYDLARARTDARAAAVIELLRPHFENRGSQQPGQ